MYNRCVNKIVSILLFLSLLLTPAVSHASGSTLASWEFYDVASRVAPDSSGNGIAMRLGDGVSASSGFVTTPWYPDGTVAPGSISTANDSRLNPGKLNYVVSVRFRTTDTYGNIAQKGQAASSGGYWKVDMGGTRLFCLFRGSVGTVSAGTDSANINDGLWHTVTCKRLQDRVVLLVDGVRVETKFGVTGSIANSAPLSMGGKLSCNEGSVSCDYFAADYDWLRVTR